MYTDVFMRKKLIIYSHVWLGFAKSYSKGPRYIMCQRHFVFLSTEIGAMLYINIYFFDTDYEVLSYRVEWYTKKE